MKPDYSLILTCKTCGIKDNYPLMKKQYDDLFSKDLKITVKCIHCGKTIHVKYKNELVKEKKEAKKKNDIDNFIFVEGDNNKKIKIRKSDIITL